MHGENKLNGHINFILARKKLINGTYKYCGVFVDIYIYMHGEQKYYIEFMLFSPIYINL